MTGSHELNPSFMAINKDDLVIPLIDFGPFFSGTPSDKHAVALSITDAFKTSGFLYLKNHGIPPSVVSRVFSSSARFFDRSQEQKDGLGWTTPQSNRGYVAIGREKLATLDETGEIESRRESAPDIKETMEIGREGVDGLPNRWPDHLDDEGKDFKETMLAFFEMCKGLHTQVMSSIALGMNLPEHFFDEFNKSEQGNTVTTALSPCSSRTSMGGLQVRSPRGTFVDATPIADTIVINAGDLLARWSNDTIKSTRHRVIQPPKPEGEREEDSPADTYPSRYSIAYFCNPNNDKVIKALPGTYGEDLHVAKKYTDVLAGDYLVQRLAETY
ncbi:uncharacterized protein N7469_007078 [Penicillium citrinum]|uniref:Fe2OG dioxygenase domain-containing protein n=1 Tax=Penicillium citrinum TaxID=5077 RepID=A0A9W9TLB1_PENCI|nr:uncharacterized protein N7469_007078 [Penicillium citrinum]KAJ5227072.1 hypothetical protein N7469_007078 [Penicillium citrinum]